jgi:alpha-galactosidase
MEKIGFSQSGLEQYAGPGRWNDPDMLTVGMYGRGHVGAGGCTDTEYRVQFSLWCLLAAPLMMGCDVRNIASSAKNILLNPRLIAVNQDPLGRQGWFVGRDWDKYEVWMKPLANGSIAVGLFNRSADNFRPITAAWEALHVPANRTCNVVDLWTGDDLGEYQGSFSTQVNPHDTMMILITPR